jgi:hypothetical protein
LFIAADEATAALLAQVAGPGTDLNDPAGRRLGWFEPLPPPDAPEPHVVRGADNPDA